MKLLLTVLTGALLGSISCGTPDTAAARIPVELTESTIVLPDSTIEGRISVPEGFKRLPVEPGSFQEYLRQLPLKPEGSMVKLHNGLPKLNVMVHEAVVDLDIGRKDLHQCADAVIRLHAEYHFRNGNHSDIQYDLTNGFRVEYERWRDGERVQVRGNETWWAPSGSPDESYSGFWKYLEFIFTYAGTISLSNELKPGDPAKIAAGNVFIQGGSPGHAVIVVDVAENEAGERVFLLAQSYMPAQEIHVLKNPMDNTLSPWYKADFGDELNTPEWTFRSQDLKAF